MTRYHPGRRLWIPPGVRKAADGGPGALCCAATAARLVAELGAGAGCCELVPCVVHWHGWARANRPLFLQFDETGAVCCERLRGADPERVPRHATGNARGRYGPVLARRSTRPSCESEWQREIADLGRRIPRPPCQYLAGGMRGAEPSAAPPSLVNRERRRPWLLGTKIGAAGARRVRGLPPGCLRALLRSRSQARRREAPDGPVLLSTGTLGPLRRRLLMLIFDITRN